jgi:hypothetical protein
MSETLGDDLIAGTERIGANLGLTRRQAQHAIETQQIPAFMFCGKWATRRSTLRAHFEKLENAGAAA